MLPILQMRKLRLRETEQLPPADRAGVWTGVWLPLETELGTSPLPQHARVYWLLSAERSWRAEAQCQLLLVSQHPGRPMAEISGCLWNCTVV